MVGPDNSVLNLISTDAQRWWLKIMMLSSQINRHLKFSKVQALVGRFGVGKAEGHPPNNLQWGKCHVDSVWK